MLTCLDKNKGFPANQKGSGKNKGWNEEFVHPASRKLERATWAKMGILVGWKPERAVQEKVKDWKRMTMSREITTIDFITKV